MEKSVIVEMINAGALIFVLVGTLYGQLFKLWRMKQCLSMLGAAAVLFVAIVANHQYNLPETVSGLIMLAQVALMLHIGRLFYKALQRKEREYYGV